MRQTLALLLLLAGYCQAQYVATVHTAPSGGGSNPTEVGAACDFTGGGSVSYTIQSTSNHLIVYSAANDTTTGHTCSDGSNTYSASDGHASGGSGGNALILNLFHVKTITSAGAKTISCTGTTPIVCVAEYSGGTGDLDSASAGGTGGNAIIGIQATGSLASCSPGSFTPTDADTIMMDGFASTTGGTISAVTQTDSGYTTISTCLNGASCFVGAAGYRAVTSSASYSDGISWTTSQPDRGCIHGAYK